MSERTVDHVRRRICQAACASGGLIALSAIPGCGGPATTTAVCAASAGGVGSASAIPLGGATYIESLGVFVCRDSGGYYAMDAACTHIGTDLNFVDEADGFKCPLHFSTFDFNGHVTMGPAMLDLKHYELCTTDSGILVVDTSKQVTPDTRLLV